MPFATNIVSATRPHSRRPNLPEETAESLNDFANIQESLMKTLTTATRLSRLIKASIFGALLTDPARLLEGTGKRGRHVKLRPGRPIDTAALDTLKEQLEGSRDKKPG